MELQASSFISFHVPVMEKHSQTKEAKMSVVNQEESFSTDW